MSEANEATVVVAIIDGWSAHPMRSGGEFFLVSTKNPVDGPPGPYALFRELERWLVREKPGLLLTLRIWPAAQLAHRPRAEILRFEEVEAG